MKFRAGESVSLGGNRYLIREHLGMGSVTDVYLANPEVLPSAEVVVKVIADRTNRDLKDEETQLKVEAVKTEAKVLAKLNQAEDQQWSSLAGLIDRLRYVQATAMQRRIVACLDSGEFAAEWPFLIQEKAPPIFKRFAVDDLGDERRMLTVMHAVSAVVALAHQNRIALRDFDPGVKGDRIRVRWSDDKNHFELKIIDWNISGGPDDMAQDLFLFGRHLYYFLFGRHLVLENNGLPPVSLGMGNPDWEELSDGSRQILQRLLHRDPDRRYRRADELEVDLAWWCGTLEQFDAPNALSRLQDRFWQARHEGRHDRALAVSSLALKLDSPPETREAFESWRQQARGELEMQDWQPIAHAYGTLLTGAYDKAVREFSEHLRSLPNQSEAAHLARILQMQAQVGSMLKGTYPKGDVRDTLEWESLAKASDALVGRRWKETQGHLRRVIHLQPAADEWQPIKAMQSLAEAGLLFQEGAELSVRAEPNGDDVEREDWEQIETEQVALLKEAISKFEQAEKWAPLESGFLDRLEAEQSRLERRLKMLTQCQNIQRLRVQSRDVVQHAQEFENSGDLVRALQAYEEGDAAYRKALDQARSVVDADPAHYRARFLKESIEFGYRETAERADIVRQVVDKLDQAEKHCGRRDFREAINLLRQASELMPGQKGIQKRWVDVWQLLQIEEALAQVHQYLGTRQLLRAEKLLGQVLAWEGRPPDGFPFSQDLPTDVTESRFQFASAVKDKFERLLNDADQIGRWHEQAQEATKKGEYSVVVANLEQLEQQGYSLTAEEQGWLDEARRRLEVLLEAEKLLEIGDPESTQQALNLVKDDGGSEAARLQEKAQALLRKWAEEEAEERLNRLVTKNLEKAIGEFRERNLVDAERLAQEVLAWEGQSLRELPGGDKLPRDVGSRRFRVPPAVLAEAKALLGKASEVSRIRSQIENARAKGDHTVVVTGLEQLAEKVDSLTEEEKSWKAEAQQRARALVEAERILSGTPDLDEVESVIEQLRGDPSPQAEQLRKETEFRSGLLRQVQVHKATAIERIQSRNETEAQMMLQQTLNWDGRPLSWFPGSQSLPQVVKARPFRLAPAVKDEMERLLNDADLIRRWREQAQEATKNGEHSTVIANLEQLGQQGHSLTAEEQKWLGEARRRLEVLQEAEKLLGAGDLESTQRALDLVKDDSGSEAARLQEKAQALLRKWAEEEAEERLNRLVAKNLEKAIGEFRERNLAGAEHLAQEVLAWEGHFLRKLPGGDKLPQDVGSRRFRVPPAVLAEAKALVGRVSEVSRIRSQVENARAKGDHAAVVTGLEQLAEKVDSLTEEEKSWKAEAQQRVRALVEAERILSGTPDLDEVESVIEQLRGDPSPQADQLRKKAEFWSGLLRQVQVQKETAIERIQNRGETEAQASLVQVLAWDGRPLGRFPDSKNLPQVVKAHLFRLAPAVKDEIDRLLNDTDLIRRWHEQAQEATKKGEHSTVIANLEQLGQQGYSLTAEEQRWLDEARRRLEVLQEAEKLLEAGDPESTQRALDLVKDDGGSEAARLQEKAQALLRKWAEEEAEERLNRLVAKNLEKAIGEFEERNLAGAERLAQEVLAWEGQSLRKLPGGDKLPQDVGSRRFRVPPAVLAEAKALVGRVSEVSRIRSQVENARAKGDHAAVVTGLEQLAEKVDSLTEEEKSWKAEAQQRARALVEAERILSGTPDLDEVELVIEQLAGDSSPQADQLRKEAGFRSEILRQVQIHIATAIERIQSHNETGAQKMLEQTLSWDGRPLGWFPGSKNLPQVMKGRPFRLAPEVKDEIKRLLNDTDLIRHWHEQAQEATKKGEHSAVIANLEQLEQKGYSLTAEEQGWLDKASRRLEVLQEAEKLLEVSNPKSAQRALELLRDDAENRAIQLREKAQGFLSEYAKGILQTRPSDHQKAVTVTIATLQIVGDKARQLQQEVRTQLEDLVETARGEGHYAKAIMWATSVCRLVPEDSQACQLLRSLLDERHGKLSQILQLAEEALRAGDSEQVEYALEQAKTIAEPEGDPRLDIFHKRWQERQQTLKLVDDRLRDVRLALERREWESAAKLLLEIHPDAPQYPHVVEMTTKLQDQFRDLIIAHQARSELTEALLLCSLALQISPREDLQKLQEQIERPLKAHQDEICRQVKNALRVWDLEMAEKALAQGLAIEPQEPRLLALQTQRQEMVELTSELRDQMKAGWEALWARAYPKAKQAFGGVLAIAPDFREAQLWHDYTVNLELAVQAVQREQYDQAPDLLRQAEMWLRLTLGKPLLRILPDLKERRRQAVWDACGLRQSAIDLSDLYHQAEAHKANVRKDGVTAVKQVRVFISSIENKKKEFAGLHQNPRPAPREFQIANMPPEE